MSRNVIVVGGGLCGLTTALGLARRGVNVTLFEKSQVLGGRAITHQRQGFRFNIGPHALYRNGASMRVLRQLGIPVDGGIPPNSGIALYRGERYHFPGSLWGFLNTALLSGRAKIQFAAAFFRLRTIDPRELAYTAVTEWLDRNFDSERARAVAESLIRLSTYSDSPHEQSAEAGLDQLKIARGGVLYVHEGWQRMVESLQSAAVSAGVNFVTSSRVVGILHEAGSVRGIELGELEEPVPSDTYSVSLREAMGSQHGTQLRADVVVLAVDPQSAAFLLGHHGHVHPAPWRTAIPVRLACLDVGLSSLPKPKNTFALGIDQPLYFSVHSAWAHLAPRDGAMIHVARYLGGEEGEKSAEAELEGLLDELQPGWRDRVVHRRFLPRMTVSNSLVRASEGGYAARPDITSTGLRNLLIAGDWVGNEGLLSDAALASGARVAAAIA